MGKDLYNMIETLKYRGLVVKVYEDTVVATGNDNGSDDEIDVLGFKEASFFIYCSAIANPGTATVTIQTKNPNPAITRYEDLVAFSALAAVGGEKKDVTANLGSRLSLKWVLAGGTTSFTFSVYAVLKIV